MTPDFSRSANTYIEISTNIIKEYLQDDVSDNDGILYTSLITFHNYDTIGTSATIVLPTIRITDVDGIENTDLATVMSTRPTNETIMNYTFKDNTLFLTIATLADTFALFGNLIPMTLSGMHITADCQGLKYEFTFPSIDTSSPQAAMLAIAQTSKPSFSYVE